MRKLRIAYFGTPDYSAKLLNLLLHHQKENNYEIVLVVTSADALVGRKQVLTKSPVKVVAEAHGAPIYDGDLRLDRAKLINLIKEFDIDIAILFAYGHIIKKDIIDLFKGGIWNIHPSDLPKYRGASPIAYAVMMGEDSSKISIMHMDEKMDHGPLIDQVDFVLGEYKLSSELIFEVADLIIPKLNDLINNYQKDSQGITHEQNHENATFTKLFTRDDGFIPEKLLREILNTNHESQIIDKTLNTDLKNTLIESLCPLKEYKDKYGIEPRGDVQKVLFNYFRALSPWPGLWTTITTQQRVRRVKIIKMEIRDGLLKILEIQMDGEGVKKNNLF